MVIRQRQEDVRVSAQVNVSKAMGVCAVDKRVLRRRNVADADDEFVVIIKARLTTLTAIVTVFLLLLYVFSSSITTHKHSQGWQDQR